MKDIHLCKPILIILTGKRQRNKRQGDKGRDGKVAALLVALSTRNIELRKIRAKWVDHVRRANVPWDMETV